MADDKKKLGDYIELKLPAFGGQVATIYRTDTTEEQWQMAKAAAKESGTLHSLKESEKAGMSGGSQKPSSSADVIELKDPMTGVVAKMPRGDISERRWKALKEQVSKGETKLDWQQNKETAQAAEPAPVAAPKPAQPAAVPEATQSHRTISGAGVTLTPDEPQASGPRKFFGDAMMGALPGPPGMGTPPGPIPAGQGSILEDPRTAEQRGTHPQPAPAVPSGAGGGAPGPSPVSGMTPYPGDAPGPTQMQTPADALKQTGASLLGPSPGAQMTDLVNAGKQSFQQPPATPAQPAPAPVDPNATGAKLDTQTTTTTPGSGGSSLEGDLNRAYADQMRARRALAGEEVAKAAETAQLEVQKAKSLQIAEQARAAKAQAQLEAQNQLIAAQMKVAESLSEQLKVDPKRLWANRTAEQKSNAQLAGFLFGLAGTGADYVRSLQQEVQKDVETQVQQFEANRASKVAQFNAYGNVFAQYRQQGLDAATSAEAAKASILDVHAAKLKEIEARYQGTTAGARAAEAAAALGVERVAALNKLRDSAAQRANLMEARTLQRLDIEAKLEARKAKAAGGGKEESPGTRSQVAQIDQALDAVDRLLADASNTGAFEQFADAHIQLLRGVLPESAERLFDQIFPSVAQRERRAAEVGGTAKKAVTGEALSGEERKQAEANVPRPGLTQNQNAAIKELREQLLAKRKSLESSRFSIVATPASSASNYTGGE